MLITGASAGIGRATALAFAAEGSDLFLVARRGERLQAVVDEILSAHDVAVEAEALDVADRKAVDRFAAKRAPLLRSIDVLVNNAGLAKGVELVHEAKPEDWETMVHTNILGLFYLMRHILPHMVSRRSGHVVNLGSVAGRWTYKGGNMYAATKHAVRALTEGMRMDLLGTNVRVTEVEPGLVETEFSVVRLGDQGKADRVYADMVPLVPEDIADIIVWACRLPAHVNVQELVVFPTDQAAVGQVHRHPQEVPR